MFRYLWMPTSVQPTSGDDLAVASDARTARWRARKLPLASEWNWPARAEERLRLLAAKLPFTGTPRKIFRTRGEGRLVAGTAESERQLIGLLTFDGGFQAPSSVVWLAGADPQESVTDKETRHSRANGDSGSIRLGTCVSRFLVR